MFLYIRQSGMNFVFRRTNHKTPCEMTFTREYASSIITQLHKQNIVDYIITEIHSSKLSDEIKDYKTIEQSNVIDKQVIIKNNNENTDGIKDILNELLTKTTKVESKINEISSNPVNIVQQENIKRNKLRKKKDDDNTFIPTINTKGMGIKTNVKSEKSSSDSSSSADILRQLLKGI